MDCCTIWKQWEREKHPSSTYEMYELSKRSVDLLCHIPRLSCSCYPMINNFIHVFHHTHSPHVMPSTKCHHEWSVRKVRFMSKGNTYCKYKMRSRFHNYNLLNFSLIVKTFSNGLTILPTSSNDM